MDMIDVEKFREQGYLLDSLENYTDLINFAGFKDIKSKIDNKNIKRFSRYDYWYKFNNLSYQEEVVYENLLKKDDVLSVADFIYEKSHEYMVKKMDECGFEATWVFGTSMDNEIDKLLYGEVISNFQQAFANKYYSDKNYKSYMKNVKLQFYDKGCEIKLHDDGKPADRICVFLYFLNDEWKDENGGHLILYDKNGNTIKINPVFPNFVVLDSDLNLFHKVERVNKNIKYNIVSFYSGIV
jgi:Rps23 Pro-64 3,4-dihydroxylase Tpa1-like proline 4-hydroxylase